MKSKTVTEQLLFPASRLYRGPGKQAWLTRASASTQWCEGPVRAQRPQTCCFIGLPSQLALLTLRLSLQNLSENRLSIPSPWLYVNHLKPQCDTAQTLLRAQIINFSWSTREAKKETATKCSIQCCFMERSSSFAEANISFTWPLQKQP